MKLTGDRKLWLCVGLAFGLLFGAWTTLFTLAARNRVATVPLTTSERWNPTSGRVGSASDTQNASGGRVPPHNTTGSPPSSAPPHATAPR
jgi:hypothetical protein